MSLHLLWRVAGLAVSCPSSPARSMAERERPVPVPLVNGSAYMSTDRQA